MPLISEQIPRAQKQQSFPDENAEMTRSRSPWSAFIFGRECCDQTCALQHELEVRMRCGRHLIVMLSTSSSHLTRINLICWANWQLKEKGKPRKIIRLQSPLENRDWNVLEVGWNPRFYHANSSGGKTRKDGRFSGKSLQRSGWSNWKKNPVILLFSRMGFQLVKILAVNRLHWKLTTRFTQVTLVAPTLSFASQGL